MRIVKVFYDIFESDAWWLDRHASSDTHELDREIRLVSDDGQSIFISWCSDPVQYSICTSTTSFFLPPVPVARDMTASSIWTGITNDSVTLQFLDQNHQVLEIRSSQKVVYCWTSAFDVDGDDVVYVSTSKPKAITEAIDRVRTP